MVQHIFLNVWSFLKTESTQLTALTALIGVFFALWNLWKLSRDSRSRTRPYVYLEPKLGVQLNGQVDLVITNYGNTPAERIRITPLTPIEPHGDDDWMHKIIQSFLTKELFLGPRANIRVMWRSARNNRPAGAPENIKLKVTYYGSGFWRQHVPYKELVTVDTSYTQVAPEPSQGSVNENSDKQLEALKNINNALRALNMHIGMK